MRERPVQSKKPGGNRISDAMILAKRLDMAPEVMSTMKSTIEEMPRAEPGVYRFKAAVTAEGGWQLLLGAGVRGEPRTVNNELVLKVMP